MARNAEKEHRVHSGHTHEHGPNCGHTSIQHNGHTDYLHDGCMHHPHEGHIDEHRLEVSSQNPDSCTPGGHDCAEHDGAHRHGPGCGHDAVPHGDHTDYVVGDHLHHMHGDHCDDHGSVRTRPSARS